jgi:putative endonuclease
MSRCMDAERTVYILQSTSEPTRFYTGLTTDLVSRLQAHNEGRSSHTARYRPWRVVVAVAFADEQRALAFERYLKTGSGAEFARRHFK